MESPSGAAVAATSESATLREEIGRLSRQVRQLIKIESALYQQNQAFDAQVKVYRRLSEIGHQFNGARSADVIVDLAVRFIVYELNFERVALFLREPPGGHAFTVRRTEGYYDQGERDALSSYVLADDDARLVELLLEGRRLIVTHGEAGSMPSGIGRELGMDEFFAHPIGGEPGRVMGILLVGNSMAKARYQTRVRVDSNFAVGLTNLVNEATIALNNVRFYRELEEERKLLEIKVDERTLALQTAYQDLKRLDELKTQFFANVSHELRTPLTLSIGPLDLLASDPAIPRSAKRNIEVLRNNQHRLLRLINDLLDFAKLEAGKMTAYFAPIRLVDTLKEYLATLEAAAHARGIGLSFRTERPDFEIYVDKSKFEKIAMNLLSNAFKFTPNGGRIEVCVGSSGPWVLIDVRDSGIGIDREGLGAIFERFAQVDASATRRYSGTGIGLALVKELMELHQGKVTVASTPGQGSTFTLHFRCGYEHLAANTVASSGTSDVLEPSREALAEFAVDYEEAGEETEDFSDPTADPAEVSAGGDAGLEQGATVIVVDDTPSLRRMLCRILRPIYRVFAAEDGVAALELCRKHQPDLVVSDMMMPRMSGIELCQAIKREPGALARTPVILVTARADMSSKLQGLEQGADDYLAKPFNIQELLVRCRNIVRLRRQEQQIRAAEKQVAERDLALAGAVQALMLPEGSYRDKQFVIGALCKPAALVGGDWWWYGVARNGALLIVIGDVTGHGAGPAMVAATAIGTCRTYAQLTSSEDTEKLWTFMNQNLLGGCRGDFSLSLAAIEFRPDLGTFRVWRAGAPPLIHLVGGEKPLPIGTPGTLLGDKDFQVGRSEGRYSPGQRFALFTDGAYDFSRAAGRPFGLPGLLRLLDDTRHETPNAAKDAIWGALREQQRGKPLEDDLTLVLIDAC
ncbi:MAG: response regulator [Proteobacteria bacterium]|nr:response regulator [Pseudomonadota bacterium]